MSTIGMIIEERAAALKDFQNLDKRRLENAPFPLVPGDDGYAPLPGQQQTITLK